MLVDAVVVLGAIVVLQLSFVIGYLRDNRAILQNLKAVQQDLKQDFHTAIRNVEDMGAMDDLQWHKKGTFAHEMRKEFQWYENGSFAHELRGWLEELSKLTAREIQSATNEILGSLSEIEKNTSHE